MNKQIKKGLALALCLVMMVASVPFGGLIGVDFGGAFEVSATDESYSGSCGDNVTYSFDSTSGTLTISGTGDMTDWSMGGSLWNSYRELILSVVIGSGVTSIGDCAFYYCTSLESIEIPDSVTSIDASAFTGCTSLTTIYFTGTQAEWDAIVAELEMEGLTDVTIEYEVETTSGTTGVLDTLTSFWQKIIDFFKSILEFFQNIGSVS